MSSVALIDDHESVRLGLEAACARAGVGVVVHSGASVRAYLSWRRAVGKDAGKRNGEGTMPAMESET